MIGRPACPAKSHDRFRNAGYDLCDAFAKRGLGATAHDVTDAGTQEPLKNKMRCTGSIVLGPLSADDRIWTMFGKGFRWLHLS